MALVSQGAAIIAGILFAIGSPLAIAQNFPNKPIRIVTSGVGGSPDIVARLVAHELTPRLGQQVIVDNRASGIIQGEAVLNATPDGYTLLISGSTFVIGPLLQNNIPYDPIRDFAPVTLIGSTPNVLVVHPAVPANSVRELIALARSKPGALNYASGGTGSSNHLAAELFKSMAGVDIVRIPYKSVSGAIADLLAGQVQLTFGSAASVAPHIKTGKLRALGVTSAGPSELFPGVLPIAQAGVPGYESVGMTGMFAPGRTPSARIRQLNQEIVRLLQQPEIKEKFLGASVETVGSTPQQFQARIKLEVARLGKVIRDAGIKGEE
jgi:tripartite-type tricarboxylate transporter receptor subunit TctC